MGIEQNYMQAESGTTTGFVFPEAEAVVKAEINAAKINGSDIDAVVQRINQQSPSRERALAITKLQEGIMWLGADILRIEAENPGIQEN